MTTPTYTIQKKIEDEDVNQLHHLCEAAKPRNVKGDKRAKALQELYDYTKEKFDVLWKRNDGSRAFQILVLRGDEKLRNQLITDFEKILFDAATTRYSCHIVNRMILKGNSAQRDRIFKILKGRFDELLSHKIGHKVLETLYDHSNSEQKSLLLLDFYGPQWKRQKTPISFENICKQGKSIRNAAITNLSNNIRRVLNKNLGYLKLTQRLLFILSQAEPSALGQFAVDFKDYCYSVDGLQAAIIAIQNAKQDDIKASLILIEPKQRKSVLIGAGEDEIAPPATANQDEEEEEEEAVEDFGEEEEENQNCQPTKKKAKSDGETELGAVTASIANDQYGWRALCCAISYNTDINVIKDEVIPNIFDQWENICNNKWALQLLIRLISVQQSVFHDLSFQKDKLNEELKSLVLPILAEHALESIDTLGPLDEGRYLVATIMKNLVDNALFSQFANAVFTKENVVDKIMHKLVRSCIQVIGAKAADVALKTINKVGIEEVLKTPGAWIVKELISTGRYGEFETQVKNILKEHKFEGKAIDSILNPVADKAEKPKRRFDKYQKKSGNQNQKGGNKKK